MFNSNQTTIEVDGKEYIMSLSRKGLEAIEKYTRVSEKKEKFAKKIEIEHVDVISENENPFAGLDDNSLEEKADETMETLKRVLWICLWDNHQMNIEATRELMVKIIDENKLDELSEKIEELIKNVTKEPNQFLKNTKALKAQK
jgi:iron uptake system EfeUOB component EfeO/EfeM